MTTPCTSKRDRAAAWRAHNASLPAQRACVTDLQGTLQTSDQHAAPPGLRRDSKVQLGSRHHLDIMHQASADQHVCCPMNSAAEPSQLSALQAATNAATVSFRDLLQPHTQLAPGQATEKGISIMAAPARRKKPTYARLGVAGSHHTGGEDAAGAPDMAETGQKRFKIRNRFRASVFRRCCFLSAHETVSSHNDDGRKDIAGSVRNSCCPICATTQKCPCQSTIPPSIAAWVWWW